MGTHLSLAGGIVILLLIISGSSPNVHVSVDLVTRLSNNWIPMVVKEISKQNENVATSPYGLMSSLAMVFEATSDKTRKEFIQALNISSEEVGGLRKGFKAYCDSFLRYSNDPEAAGSFNSVSMTSSFKMNETYKETLEKYYCANISESLQGNQSALELNSITGVMSHWKDYEKLAVYTFLSHRPMIPFRKRNGSTVSVPMIPQVGALKIGRWENSQVVLLPLQARLVDLLIIMPDEPDKVDVVVKKLSNFTIPFLVQSLQKQEVEVFLPQMTIVNKNLNLTSVLIRSGIRRVFDPKKANLRASLTEGTKGIHLAKLEQNAFFSTSFVALNSVSGISAGSSNKRRKRDTKSIYVNQPFTFFIVHKDTQLVLLCGKVENPVQLPV